MEAPDMYSFVSDSPLGYYCLVMLIGATNMLPYTNNRVSLERVVADLSEIIRKAGLYCRENPLIITPDHGLRCALQVKCPFAIMDLAKIVERQMVQAPVNALLVPLGLQLWTISSETLDIIDMSARDLATRMQRETSAAIPVVDIRIPDAFTDLSENDAVKITAPFRTVLYTLASFPRGRDIYRFYEIAGKKKFQIL